MSEKIDITITKEFPLLISSQMSPSEFGTVVLEKGGYIEISTNMDITIDTLTRTEDPAVLQAASERAVKFDIIVKGQDGADSGDAEKGMNGGYGRDGEKGGSAEPAGDGENAPSVTITIYEIKNKFSILNTGGTGGSGGAGGDGGNGGDGDKEISGGDGGNGGDGGDAGKGGDGGELTVYVKDVSLLKHTEGKASHGKGGLKGRGGSGGKGAVKGKKGDDGSNGSFNVNGGQGKTKIMSLTEKEGMLK